MLGPALGYSQLPNVGLPAVSLPAITFESLLSHPPICSATNGTCIVLPVTLLRFDAKRLNINEVLLQWQTTNEINNAGFEVERSLGNTFNFVRRTIVPAKISSDTKKDYELVDNNSYSGTSYYRLKQINRDGKYVYSNIVTVIGYTVAEALSVYPNPARSDVKATLFSTQSGSALLTVITAEGKTVVQQKITLQQGSNNYKMGLSGLLSGMYTIQVVLPSGSVVFNKFVKER